MTDFLTKADFKGGLTSIDPSSALDVATKQYVDLRALIASPTFTGTPLSTTAAVDTNTTQIATTAFVIGQGYLKSAAAASAYQPLDSDLTALAGLTATTGNMILSVGSAWASQTPAQVKTALALSNVDNTSDVNKPVSTAQAAADALKANIASPTFTGTPAAPTATVGTNTTQIATTAFVLANSGGISQAQGDARYLQLTGGTLSGNLVLPGNLQFGITPTYGANYPGLEVPNQGAMVFGSTDTYVVGALGPVHLRPNADSAKELVITNTQVTAMTPIVLPADPTTALQAATKQYVDLRALIASPTFTGTPAAPTATAGTNTTQLATTAFVTTADNLKANLASPTFTGVPAAPTAAALTNTTQLATTAFVTTADNLKANLASPTFTGTPAAPTAATATNTTQLATTAFVQANIGAHSHSATSEYTWVWNSSTVMADPTGGNIRTNTAAGTPATQIAVSITNYSASNVGYLMRSMSQGDTILLQDTINFLNWERYRITGAVVDNSTWFQIPVAVLGSSGSAITKGNYALVKFEIEPGGAGEVYIGTSQPSDASVEWWIDTDDNTGAGLSITDADARYVAKSTYTQTGFRNFVRNGDMGIAQRGNGPISTGQVYVIDGWGNGAIGGTSTHSRVVVAPGLGSNQLSVVVSGHAAAGDYSVPYQGIEDVNTLNGASSVLSFSARAASGTPKITIELTQMCGTGGSGDFINTFGPVTLSTTMTRYTVPITLPSTVGKTVGANNQLRLHFWLSAGSTYAARTLSIGIQNNTFYFTDIQLEAGTAATPFEKLPQQMQMAWCQRYFQRWYQPPMVGVAGGTASIGRVGMPLQVAMRAVPIATLTGALPVYDGTATTTITGLTTSYCTPQSMEWDAATSSTLAANRVGRVYQNSTSTNYIDLVAEL